jgi:hypothetical protein
VPPPPTSPERRLPLRQLTFRATLQCFPPKRGPGEIGRVFPHFEPQKTQTFGYKRHKEEQVPSFVTFVSEGFVPFVVPQFVTLTVTVSVFMRQFSAN